MSLKNKLMDMMMGSHFKNMSSEEKQKMMDNMMDKFLSGMSDEEKKNMMSEMMPKMMKQMMGGGMMGGMGNNPMMGMMGMMMGNNNEKGEGKKPWDMCGDMMKNFTETANSAKFANQELRGLFDEWCSQVESEILGFINSSGSVNIKELTEKFNLSEESIKFLLNKLALKGKINFKI